MDFRPPRKVLCVGVADSQLKWLNCVVQPYLAAGYDVDYVVSERPEIQVTPEILAAAGIEKEPLRMSTAQVADSDLCFQYSFIFVIDHGSNLLRFFHRFDKACRRNRHLPRPIICTGYIGMVLEKHTEGILWRTGADQILVNSEADFRRYTKILRDLAYPTDSLLKVGLVLLLQQKACDNPPHTPPRRILFAAQPHFPGRIQERLYVLECLVEYAHTHPTREVVIKLRVPPGIGSFHREPYHYKEIFSQLGIEQPKNLIFAYGPMTSHLKDCDVLVTVSSTAALEAAAARRPFALVSDFGIKESIGTEAFVGSRSFASFAEILADRLPQVNQDWLHENGVFEPVAANLESARNQGEEALRQQMLNHRQLPLNKPYYIGTASGAYYRRRLRL